MPLAGGRKGRSAYAYLFVRRTAIFCRFIKHASPPQLPPANQCSSHLIGCNLHTPHQAIGYGELDNSVRGVLAVDSDDWLAAAISTVLCIKWSKAYLIQSALAPECPHSMYWTSQGASRQ